jgi:hypothetical protein
MQERLPKPRLPAPAELVSPLVGIENSVMNAIQAPFTSFGLPTPPRIPGPMSLVSQVAAQIPPPPQLPQPPEMRLPRLG